MRRHRVIMGALLAVLAMLALFVVAASAQPAAAQDQPAQPEQAAAATPANPGDKSVAEKILDILVARGTISQSEYDALKAEAVAEKEQAQQAAEAAKSKPEDFKVYWKDGLRMETQNKDFVVRLGGRLHVDWAAISSDSEVQQALGSDAEGFGAEIRRAWLELNGSMYRHFDYRLQIDFANNTAKILDAWMQAKNIPYVGAVRIGNQKEPFSIEQLISTNDLTFMERGLYSAMLQLRDIGLTVNNTVLDKRLSYSVGAFVNSDSSSYNNFDDWQIAARVTGLPLYDPDRKMLLHLAANYAHRFRSGDSATVRYRSRPESHLAPYTVDTGSFAVDHIDQLGGELAFVYGPFALQSEFIQTFVEVPDAGTMNFPAAYAQVSYFLTGETRPYANGVFGGIKPLQPFNPWSGSGGWGAWELAARWSWLDLNDSAGDMEIWGGEENDFLAGVNWYLNDNIRIMLNYIYALIEDRQFGGDIDRGNMQIVQGRFQLAF